MTDDQHGEGTPQQGGQSGWERLPQGDYDDGATTFVQLPEGGIDALLAADSPLAAPGHGYVPPPIAANPPAAGTDPSGTGSWAMPAEGTQWHDPNAGQQQPPAQDGFTYNPGSTGQWTFEEPAAQEGTAPGHDVTGEWSIPVAGGDLPDESGEFSTSALVEQWGGTPPATLPGGAPAPWATEQIGTAWTAPPPPARAEESAAEEPPVDAPAEATGVPSGTAVEAPAPDNTAEEAPEGAQEPAGTADRSAEADSDPTGPQEAKTPAEASDAETSGTEDADAADPAAEPTPPPHDDHPLASYVLSVNGADRPVTDAWIGESLLYVLRERLGLAGAKDGCSQGECGACNVQVDGRLVASCLVPAVTAASSEVRTVEGLAVDGQPSDVQRALARCGAVQCGFCVPGMAMTVHDLLEGNPAPTELEARQALCGNLCRCSGYRGVLAAVRDVVAERAAHAAADSDTGADTDEARIPHQAGPGAGGVNAAAYEAQEAPPQAPHDPGQSYGGQGLSFGGQDDTYGGQGQSFGGHGDTYGGQGQSFGGQDQSFGGQDQSYGGQDQSYGGQDRSFGGHDDSYGGQGQSFGGHDDTYGGQGQSFGGQDQSFGGQSDTYGGQGQSFGGHDDTYGGQGRNFGDQDQSFGQDGGQA
ncbi:2Fe-2S iron-sulfur cluster-binding protein [Streptomyces neyagawaensis]|uniref:2Fe-2S iron-sulfur cluster-binding protein n=2 Tax=Streptomyces neyagawaensis TaxID=42238 RepID=UPI00201CFEE1|nr:2Fe-2S iron-sulfur cluster-binding protein [Streptomyces neyagawaensis]MCL6736804.1 2Fe-2S iron-sulfur cluster-binding protein [Streptomyces neyagawaensis]MDE1684572.1 2Fe-2S iron-sulfur cluster-binding protein [Streptomyces neyagawaensis]